MLLELREDGALDGAENMRRDRELFAALEGGGLEHAVLRFYEWANPTVSLGYHQRDEDLHLHRLERDGIAWVRRPTGGGAIWHEDEITYALAAPWPAGQRRLKRVYYDLADALVRALRSLGIAAASGIGSAPSPAVCFAGVEAHELHVHGRKLVGSAMRAGRRGFLLHGSILGGPAHLRIRGYLKEPVDLASRSTHLAALGVARDARAVVKASIHGELQAWAAGAAAKEGRAGG